MTSRFYQFPDADTTTDSMVNAWRSEDFNLIMKEGVDVQLEKPTSWNEKRIKGIRQSVRAIKLFNRGITSKSAMLKRFEHLNLSQHLVNFSSSSSECTKANLPLKSIQTFIDVAETDDPETASNCIVALSNISALDFVRGLLVECNVIHKFSTIMSISKGATSTWASGLLFYYFSCDPEIEDRVYNLSSAMLNTNAQSESVELQILTLYTLSNLMPCIDRQRVADIFMGMMHRYISPDGDTSDFNRPMAVILLPILLGMCSFTNTHATLLGNDVLEILSQTVVYAADEKDAGKFAKKKIILYIIKTQKY